MYITSVGIFKRLVLVASIVLLAACGGGGGNGSLAEQSLPQAAPVPQNISPTNASLSQLFIAGAGIKGPLAFASVELYALDTRLRKLYDPGSPLAVATTNAYAEITDLAVPEDIAPPYIMVIDGTNAIDRNTGIAPVISKLVTIITQDSLDSAKPVYATPYTTLAYHMLGMESWWRAKGDGLQATYFNDTSLSNAVLSRIDARVNFNWRNQAPNNKKVKVNTDHFSARWTGLIKPKYSEEYTFYTSSDDGVRLWVDGKLIINKWFDQGETEYSGTIRLSAGKKHSIVMEYYEATGAAVARLSWSSASQAKSIVSKNYLYSGSGSAIGGDLAQFNQDIIQAIGFGMPTGTDIFTTPPIITADATSINKQQLVVNYRAAIEALSSLLYQLSLSSESPIKTDQLLRKLARDLYSDGVIDNSTGSRTLGGIDTAVLSQNPLLLEIPNTRYLVRDIVAMMDEERSVVGSSSNVEFLKNDITVTLVPALLDPRIDSSQKIDYTESVGNTANALLLTGLVASAPVGGEPLFSLDFNKDALHTYTIDDPKTTWGARDARVVAPNAVKIVNDPDVSGAHGKAMKIFYAAGEFGYSGNSGAQWLKTLGDYDELYFAFDVYFESDAEFVKTGKLPSPRSTGWLVNQKGKVGKIKPDGTDFWTAGLSWGSGGELKAYVYHANQSRVWGDIVHWDDGADGKNTYFTPGKWHRVEIRVKTNTPGVLDGRMQGWFDGELRLDRSNFMFRMPGGEHLRIGTYLFYTFFGGGDSSFAPSEDQYVYFDNFVISEQPITH